MDATVNELERLLSLRLFDRIALKALREMVWPLREAGRAAVRRPTSC